VAGTVPGDANPTTPADTPVPPINDPVSGPRRAQRWPYPWTLRDLRSLGHYELAVEVPATSFPQVGVEEIGVNPFAPAFMTQVQFGES